MRSFNILSFAAAAACAVLPFVFAAPFAANEVSVPPSDLTYPSVTKPSELSNVNPISRRCDECQSDLHGILVYVQAQLDVHLYNLQHITPESATTENIEPILKAIVSVFVEATDEISHYSGGSILGLVELTVIANVFASIFISLCGALVVVLKVYLDIKVLIGVVGLDVCIYAFIKAIISVCPGFITVIVSLIIHLGPVCVELGLLVTAKLLTIV